MKLISMKCSGCGSALECNPSLKQIQCNYCGMVTMIDDEIIKVEHKVYNGDYEKQLESADIFSYKLKDYNKAVDLFDDLSEIFPDNPHIWLSLTKALTFDFKNYNIRKGHLVKVMDAFDKYCCLETDRVFCRDNRILYFTYILMCFSDNFTYIDEINYNYFLENFNKYKTVNPDIVGSEFEDVCNDLLEDAKLRLVKNKKNNKTMSILPFILIGVLVFIMVFAFFYCFIVLNNSYPF